MVTTEQVQVFDTHTIPIVGGKTTFTTTQHPLGPLTASEIRESSRLIRTQWPSNTDIQFKVITLREPKKADLAPFFVAERAGEKIPAIERKSLVVYYLRNTVSCFHKSRFILANWA